MAKMQMLIVRADNVDTATMKKILRTVAKLLADDEERDGVRNGVQRPEPKPARPQIPR